MPRDPLCRPGVPSATLLPAAVKPRPGSTRRRAGFRSPVLAAPGGGVVGEGPPLACRRPARLPPLFVTRPAGPARVTMLRCFDCNASSADAVQLVQDGESAVPAAAVPPAAELPVSPAQPGLVSLL